MNTLNNETKRHETGSTCCGMSHDQVHAHDGTTACHCNLDTAPEKKQGAFKRWLNRMAKANQKAFGSSGPRCGCG
jgi:hypothetical protein